MPTFGPFTKALTYGPSSRYGFHNATWYRQTAPYTHRLAYNVDKAWIGDGNQNPNTDASSWSVYPPDVSSVANNQAIQKARNRLNSSLGSSASIGTTLAEWRQSLSMIEARSLQLYHAARALRKGRLGDFRNALQLDPSDRGSRKRLAKGKTFGNVWLEHHFGWAPLVKDIGDAVDLLQSTPPFDTVRGRGSSANLEAFSYTNVKVRRELKVRCQLLAEVWVSNPNLFLANRLGFVNPAAVAWELIPFSFLVDWFVPIGGFLSQWTDFVGLSLQDPATTLTWEYTDSETYVPYPGYLKFPATVKTRFVMQRTGGIASYRLAPNRVTGLSASRGLTAVSLLLQQLKG